MNPPPPGEHAPHPPRPRLCHTAQRTWLEVDGKPFFILGGELYNSTSSDPANLDRLWPLLREMQLNTVLAAVSWELIEPMEGAFDWSSVDTLLDGARRHGLRLVLLWFGTWKNGQSTYAPAWVKSDLQRFGRVQTMPGVNSRTLSPFSSQTLESDRTAFAALMEHLGQVDAHNTVIMVQVQNECGIFGAARDHSQLAEDAYAMGVPAKLTDWLASCQASASTPVLDAWRAHGRRSGGSWAEVFGDCGDEFFMAWHIGVYVNAVAAAGRAHLELPMFTNCWLVQHELDRPGAYPSGGPVSRVMDIWKAAAPSLQMLCPDIYLPDFARVCGEFQRNDNPLFVPESSPQRGWAEVFHVLAIGGIGLSPYNIDAVHDAPLPTDWQRQLGESYAAIAALWPVMQQPGRRCRLHSILQDGLATQLIDLEDHRVLVRFTHAQPSDAQRGAGIMIEQSADEVLVAGRGFSLAFGSRHQPDQTTDFLSIDELELRDGHLVAARRLNGDDTWGHVIHFNHGRMIRRIKLYTY